MICIIASAGGHLTEAMKATALLKDSPRFYVTFSLPHIAQSLPGEEYYFIEDPHVSPVKYLRNFFQALRIFRRKRPKVIITTGAGIAVPMCVIGKIAGAKIVFIETGARITSPSRTARLLYPIADVFIVQWEPLLKYFPKAVYGGALI
jgi:UDP-N-acetylglucosamine:LPS N-acetylglucosamine transferase